jgi:hypothetical protein
MHGAQSEGRKRHVAELVATAGERLRRDIDRGLGGDGSGGAGSVGRDSGRRRKGGSDADDSGQGKDRRATSDECRAWCKAVVRSEDPDIVAFTTIVKIGLTFSQTLSAIANYMRKKQTADNNITLENLLPKTLQIFTTFVDFGFSSKDIQCVLPRASLDYVTKLWAFMFLPAVAPVMAGLFIFAIYMLQAAVGECVARRARAGDKGAADSGGASPVSPASPGRRGSGASAASAAAAASSSSWWREGADRGLAAAALASSWVLFTSIPASISEVANAQSCAAPVDGKYAHRTRPPARLPAPVT